jgi:cell division transport system permease protein
LRFLPKLRFVPAVVWVPRYGYNVIAYCIRCWRGRVVAWLATAVAIAAVLSLAAAAELFLVLAERSLSRQVRSVSELQVYLEDSAQQSQVDELQSRIASVSGVRRITYRSKSEALQIARQSPSLNAIANNTSNNPFPASLVVDLRDPAAAGSVVAIASQEPAADHEVTASYTPAQGRNISAFLSMAQAVVVGVALSALGVASLVALVLLRSEIRARRAELRILILVGTPRPVIRLPVVLEAVALGVVGSLAAFAALSYAGDNIVPLLNSYLPFLQLGSAAGAVEALSLSTMASSVLALGACSLMVRLPR